MVKLKSIFDNVKIAFKNLLQKLPITIMIIFAFTLYYMCIFDLNVDGNIIPGISTFLIIFAIISLFIETFNNKNNKVKVIIYYIINFLISLMFALIFNNNLDYILSLKKDVVLENFNLILTATVIFCVLLSIYKMYKSSNLKFHEYIYNTFYGIVKIVVFDFVINIGIVTLFYLFKFLIFNALDDDILLRMVILIHGLFFAPAILQTMYNDNPKENSKFFKVLSVYILLPIYLLVNLILYIYIIKVLVNRELPVGFIYPVVATIFILGFLIYNFIKNFDENKAVKIVVKLIPYLLIPLVALQIYTVIIRFIGYGITPARYITYMFIAFEIASIFLMLFKKSAKLEYSIIIFVILSIITTVTPFNLIKVSKWNQKSRLDSVANINFDEMTQDELEKYSSSYKFLKLQTDYEKYINDELTQKMEKISEKLNEYKEDSHLGYYQNENNVIDIRNYSTLESISYHHSINSNLNSNEDLKQYENTIFNTVSEILNLNKSQNFDIYEYMKEKNNLINVDNNVDIYVKSMNIYFDKYTDELETVYINGYLLKK